MASAGSGFTSLISTAAFASLSFTSTLLSLFAVSSSLASISSALTNCVSLKIERCGSRLILQASADGHHLIGAPPAALAVATSAKLQLAGRGVCRHGGEFLEHGAKALGEGLGIGRVGGRALGPGLPVGGDLVALGLAEPLTRPRRPWSAPRSSGARPGDDGHDPDHHLVGLRHVGSDELDPGLLQAEPPALGKASPWRCQATSGVQDPLEQASTAGRLKRPQAWSIKEQTSRRVVLGLLRAGLSVPHLNRVMQHVDGLIASR